MSSGAVRLSMSSSVYDDILQRLVGDPSDFGTWRQHYPTMPQQHRMMLLSDLPPVINLVD
jgi:hypothetical protein